MDYRCHDRVGGNDLNAKHWNQKRAANGRTYHTEDRVRHQSSSRLSLRRGDTTEHESANNANDRKYSMLLKVSNLIQARPDAIVLRVGFQ